MFMRKTDQPSADLHLQDECQAPGALAHPVQAPPWVENSWTTLQFRKIIHGFFHYETGFLDPFGDIPPIF
jgi:hypothetical protein